MQSVSSSAGVGNQSTNQKDIYRVHCTQQGNLEAFNELVLAYQDQVYNQAYWTLGDAAAAEDAAQEAFYRAYSKISSFDGLSFRAWILRITINYCLDQLRRNKRHQLLSLEFLEKDNEDRNENSIWLIDAKQTPEQIVEQTAWRALVHRCLMTLSIKDRTPIILIDIQGMDYKEAADVLNLPLGSLKSRLVRARAKLLQAVNRDPGSDQLLH